jgi:DNA excision repair protein ERCC-2
LTTLKLSVTEFVAAKMKLGSIGYDGSLSVMAQELGQLAHKRLQSKRAKEIESYHSEVDVHHTFEIDIDLTLEVSGRIDGCWQDETGTTIIEEIKSSFGPQRLLKDLADEPDHNYLRQTQLYAWILRQNRDAPEILSKLTVVSLASFKVIETIDVSTEDQWIEDRLEWVRQEWKRLEKQRAQRLETAENLSMPFASFRTGQKDLMESVASVVANSGRMLAQAPTGIGKTIAVTYPAVKDSLQRGQPFFYVTPKNSQLREGQKAVDLLRDSAPKLRSITLTSKNKICTNDKTAQCHPDQCPYAKDHYSKVATHQLIKKLAKKQHLERRILQQTAKKYEVCPYELSRQLLPYVDVVLGDYHYALSPHQNLLEGCRSLLSPELAPNLVIDEAHNFAERSLDWYEVFLKSLPSDDPSYQKKLGDLIGDLNRWIDGAKQLSKVKPRLLESLNTETVVENVDRLSREILKHLAGDQAESASSSFVSEDNPLIDYWFRWLQFKSLLLEGLGTFFVRPIQEELKISCVTAGPMNREILSQYHAVVAFSATLKPFHYHMTMCGFPDNTTTKEFATSFPKENRKILVIPQISTLYKDREHQLPRIRDAIHRIVSVHQGNYIIFFPSFEMMERTAQSFEPPTNFEMTLQPRRAGPDWLLQIRQKLESSSDLLLFAVQGGVLSEGVDFPGEQLIGAIIVGPALPMIDIDRETRRQELDGQKRGQGFELTYAYPAMAKSIQSAGRVIRTPTDRGIIVLFDGRFLQQPYAAALPQDWLPSDDESHSLVSSSIIADVRSFWEQGLASHDV